MPLCPLASKSPYLFFYSSFNLRAQPFQEQNNRINTINESHTCHFVNNEVSYYWIECFRLWISFMLNNELLIASVDSQSDGLLVSLLGTERLLGLNTPPLVRVWKAFGAPVSSWPPAVVQGRFHWPAPDSGVKWDNSYFPADRNTPSTSSSLRPGTTGAWNSTAPWRSCVSTATWWGRSGSQTRSFAIPRRLTPTGSPRPTACSASGTTDGYSTRWGRRQRSNAGCSIRLCPLGPLITHLSQVKKDRIIFRVWRKFFPFTPESIRRNNQCRQKEPTLQLMASLNKTWHWLSWRGPGPL